MSTDVLAAFSVNVPIVNDDGTPSDAFIEFMRALIKTEAAATAAAISAAIATNNAAIADSNATTAFLLADLVDTAAEVIQLQQGVRDALLFAAYADIT